MKFQRKVHNILFDSWTFHELRLSAAITGSRVRSMNTTALQRLRCWLVQVVYQSNNGCHLAADLTQMFFNWHISFTRSPWPISYKPNAWLRVKKELISVCCPYSVPEDWAKGTGTSIKPFEYTTSSSNRRILVARIQLSASRCTPMAIIQPQTSCWNCLANKKLRTTLPWDNNRKKPDEYSAFGISAPL